MNWSISRDDKVKLAKYQNHHHHGGAFDTGTKWGQTTGRVAPGRRSLSRWRKSVEATPLGQPATWIRFPATTWHQTDFSMLVEAQFSPINTPSQ
jgi:hypothetical protein